MPSDCKTDINGMTTSAGLPIDKTKAVPILGGYWLWWCRVHKQPLAWCEKDEVAKARDDALSRARGLARQVYRMKREIHNLHVALQKEIENRIHGEGLRLRIRELETKLNAPVTLRTDGLEASARFGDHVYHANSAGATTITHPASERCFLCLERL